MKIKNIILIAFILVITISSCSKDKCDAEKQVPLDEATIVKFLAEKNVVAQRHSSGVYYQIITPGTGNITYTANTTVTAKYTGRLLDGTVFDRTTTQALAFKLGGVISGWQVGVPLIQKGGKIRLIIPSGLGYGCDGSGSIPANSVLDFDIELVDVTN
jgi:FKBP-type peptidyl-prolyl cis-trans isomerase FkpA